MDEQGQLSDFEESGPDDVDFDECDEEIDDMHDYEDYDEDEDDLSEEEEEEVLPELPDPTTVQCDPALLEPSRYIGLDPSVVRGKLQNGMSYFVKKNAMPQSRADLQLIMNVGSVDEMEHEQGYAHFVEHLAFRGSMDTADKAQFEIVKLLESYGVAFGAHQNAYTSFDETVYELHVPLDDPALLPKFMTALKKLCFDIRLSESDVQQEKSIVVEEWRGSQGAASRAADVYTAALLEGSPYANRFPIGKMDVIHAATSQSVQAFYKRLYRPEVACIVAVGDFTDTDSVVTLIKQVFEGIPRGQPVSSDEQLPIYSRLITSPPPTPCCVLVQSDPETTDPSFSIDFRQKNPPESTWETVGEFRDYLAGRLLRMVCSDRLEKVVDERDPPYRVAVCSPSYPNAMMWTISIQAVPAEGRTEEAIQKVLAILVELRRDGVTRREVDRTKRQILAGLEREWRMKDSIDNGSICEDIKRHFLFRSGMPGPDEDLALARLLLPNITVDEVCEYGRTHLSFTDNCVLHVTLPPSPAFPTRQPLDRVEQATLKELLATAEASSLSLPADLRVTHQDSYDGHIELLDVEAQVPWSDGVVLSHQYDAVNGTHQVRFKGGLELVIKPTDFTQDETLFAAIAHGGMSEVPLERLHSCQAAVLLAEEVGIFGIRPQDLRDFFSETDIGIEPDIAYYQRSLEGSCSSQDVKYIFQLLHRLFTCDFEVDAEKMAQVEMIMASMLGAADRNPATLFEVTTRKLVTNGHPFFASWGVSDVKKVDPVIALQFFKQMFSDPSEFSFVFVGDVDVANIIHLTAHYLASIPSPSEQLQRYTRDNVKGLDWQFPAASVHKVLRRRMEDDVCMNTIVFPVSIGGRYEQTALSRYRENLELIRTSQVLERRLLEVLRFELGSVYNVSVGLDLGSGARPKSPQDSFHGTLTIRFTCNPADANKLQSEIFDVIDDLITDGPTPEEAWNALESERMARATSERTNDYWLEYCSASYISARYDGDMAAFLTSTFAIQRQVLENITPEIIQETARVVLAHHRDRHVLVCLTPDKDRFSFPAVFSLKNVGLFGIACVAAAAAAVVGMKVLAAKNR